MIIIIFFLTTTFKKVHYLAEVFILFYNGFKCSSFSQSKNPFYIHFTSGENRLQKLNSLRMSGIFP